MYNDERLEPIVEEALREIEGLPLESELADISPDELVQVIDVEGLSAEELGAIRRLAPAYAKVFKNKLTKSPSVVRAVGRAVQKVENKLYAETGLWYHGKKPVDNSTIEYFSTKSSGDRYNFKKDGIQPDEDTIITGITAFFEPRVTTPEDIDNILSKMMQAEVSLKIGDEEKLKIPLSYILEFSPIAAFDGNTTAYKKIYLANTRLDKGLLKLDRIKYGAKKTLQLTVDFKENFTNTTYWLFFGIEYRK